MTGWGGEEIPRPSKEGAPLWAKLFVIGLFAVGAWIALSLVFALVGRAIALVGYVVVAVVAYFVGKAVGRASADR
ncbi:MAG TPA: hypothetical protein VF152_02555 [Acidimicrobiia bacterium]